MKNKHRLLKSIKVLMRIGVIQITLAVVFTLNLYANKANSQEILDKTFSMSVENTALSQVFRQIENQTGVKFVYSTNSINASRKISYVAKNQKIESFLNATAKHYNITYRVIDGQVVLYSVNTGNKIKDAPTRVVQIVTGRVINDEGEPLQGVTVAEKGTLNATVTLANGSYSIEVNPNAVLVFSYVGYVSKEIPASSSAVINVVMGANIQDMNEVVVVAYGTQRRANITGGVEQVKGAALEGKPSLNLLQSLQGAVPSLIIQQQSYEPGQGVTINIRGINSMTGNSPLVVIDGVSGGNLDFINPLDIESISILKDAGAASMYGSRSANGVILVTTKKGKRKKTPLVTYNGIAGIQKPKIFFKPVQSFENAILRNEASVNGGGAPLYTATQIQQFKDNGSEQWFLNAILKDAMQQNHNLNISGGSPAFSYLVSGGYVNQRSNYVGPNYGLKRYNFRTNLSTEIGRFKAAVTFSYAKRQAHDHSYNSGTILVDASRVPTYYKLKDSLGRYLTNETSSQFNSLGILEQGGHRNFDDDDFFGSITAEYLLTTGLKLKGVFGATGFVSKMDEQVKFVQFYRDGSPSSTYGDKKNHNTSLGKNFFTNPQVMLDYSRTFAKHEVTGLAGFVNESFETWKTQRREWYDDKGSLQIDNPQLQNKKNSDAKENSINSYFGRAGYSYDNRYLAELSARYDGSSKFRKELRWGFFPSASVGWVASKENFMQPLSGVLSFLKFRASYGVLGNQNVNDYQYQSLYEFLPNVYGFNNVSYSGTYYRLANPDLTWEKSAAFNIGLDATVVKNLNITFDYFDKRITDVLSKPLIPGVWGHGGDNNNIPFFNYIQLQNRGWELSVNYTHNGNVLKHYVGFNIGDNKNKVLKIEGGEQYGSSEEMQFITREGLPIASYVGLKRDGYFQNLDDVLNGPKPSGISVSPGDIRYVDVDKNGVIDDKDRFVLGNPFPRYNFGFNYSLTWKLLDLSFFIQGVGKRSQFIRGELVEPFHFNYSQVMYQHQLDYWTPINPDAKYPRLSTAGSASNTNNFRRGSDLYLFDAAYARLKNLQLGFTLPQEVATKAGLQKARLYLVGQNLLTISKLKFLDPESTEFNNNLQNNGANSGRVYPTPVFYGIGLDITFK